MDQQPSQRLSDISHLFLSDVRAKTTGNAPLPVRRPPGSFKGDVSVDLTPDEFAQVFGNHDEDDTAAPTSPAASHEGSQFTAMRFKPVRAVIAHHLGEMMADRIRDLAGNFTAGGKRVGLIYADAADVRITCVEHNPHHRHIDQEPPAEPLENQRLHETLVELNQDVDQWLIVLPDPRHVESRELLRQIPDWTLLTGVDHDHVVASYRTIKGLCDNARPNLSVAIFAAVDEQEIDKTFRKLASVCDQFLHMKTGLLGAIEPGDELAEHVVLNASASHSKSQLASAPQWKLLRDMIHASEPQAVAAPTQSVSKPTLRVAQNDTPAAPVSKSAAPAQPKPMPAASMPISQSSTPTMDDEYATVIDLPHADASAASVISAIVRGGCDLIESAVKAPALPDAAVAVSRNHQLVLVAVAKQGLHDLRAIASAYRWMNENRQLIAMALPQFSIDSHAMPRLELIVDHADTTAEALQPLLERSFVRVKAYRKLRWAGKTGLLLEAA